MDRCFDYRSCPGAHFLLPGAGMVPIHLRGEGTVDNEQRNHICFFITDNIINKRQELYK